MMRFFLARLFQAVVVLFLVSVAVFLMMHLVPGDIVSVLAGPDAEQEVVDALRAKLGLDDPLPTQYVRWAAAALQGDLGTSPYIGRPVAELIGQRLPATLELAVAAIVISAIFGTLLGVYTALRQGGWADTFITAMNSLILSIPNFWFGIMGIICFAVWLGWLPAGGRKPFSEDPVTALRYLLMPAFALALDSIAMIARLVRASVLDELGRDYVTVVKAKGVSTSRLIRRHISRNAAIPVVTVIGLRFGQMLGGAVLIESVFNWPGLGRLTIEAIKSRDVVIVQGALMYFVLIYMVINLLIDLSYGWINPRIRTTGRH